MNTTQTRGRGRWFGWLTIIIWLAGGAGSGFVYFTVDDRAAQGLVSFLSVSAGTLFTLIWFSWFGPAGVGARKLVGRGAIVACILFLSIIRVDEVTGSLRPTFRFAWQKPADWSIDKIQIDEAAIGETTLAVTTPDDFPQFLGPNRNGHITGPELSTDWNGNPPRQLWKQPIGAAWSAFAVVNGLAVTMEQRGAEELVTCYEVLTGNPVWAHSLDIRHETLMGKVGPRATPSIDDGRVYAIGATGVLRCLNGIDGELLWKKDLVTDFGGDHQSDNTAIAWGRSGSPLVLRNMVIAPSGSTNADRSTLIAFDKISGEIIWRAGDVGASYSSPIVATLASVEQIVYVAQDNVLSFGAGDGKLLWSWEWPGKSSSNANVSQPHAIGTDRVFLSKGYGQGCEMLRVSEVDGIWNVESIWYQPTKLKTKFTNVVIHNGYAFGLNDFVLQCIDLQSGRERWKKGRYGFGQILGVGDHLLVQAEDGRVVLVDAAPKYSELTTFDAIEGTTWNNPALYGRYLLVRNSEEAACYEMPLAASE